METPEVKIFSAMPHTHLIGLLHRVKCQNFIYPINKLIYCCFSIGKEVISRVIRDGKELGYITNNRYYDFNYQYYNFLTTPMTLKKVDIFQLVFQFSR